MDDAPHPEGKGGPATELGQPLRHPDLDQLGQVLGVLPAQMIGPPRGVHRQLADVIEKTMPGPGVSFDAANQQRLEVLSKLAPPLFGPAALHLTLPSTKRPGNRSL